jgi:hypothetical protein
MSISTRSKFASSSLLTNAFKSSTMTQRPTFAALQTELQMPAGFVPTCMAHPGTYLNKVSACKP